MYYDLRALGKLERSERHGKRTSAPASSGGSDRSATSIPTRLIRMRKLMCDAVLDCIITGYEPLVEANQLPDIDDRHVVAAAVKSDAQAIVTSNAKDFPLPPRGDPPGRLLREPD